MKAWRGVPSALQRFVRGHLGWQCRKVDVHPHGLLGAVNWPELGCAVPTTFTVDVGPSSPAGIAMTIVEFATFWRQCSSRHIRLQNVAVLERTGQIVLVDRDNHRVMLWDLHGRHQHTWIIADCCHVCVLHGPRIAVRCIHASYQRIVYLDVLSFECLGFLRIRTRVATVTRNGQVVTYGLNRLHVHDLKGGYQSIIRYWPEHVRCVPHRSINAVAETHRDGELLLFESDFYVAVYRASDGACLQPFRALPPPHSDPWWNGSVSGCYVFYVESDGTLVVRMDSRACQYSFRMK